MSTSFQSFPISSSEIVVPSYVWVKLGSTRPIRVPTSNCSIVDELIEVIKTKLSPDLDSVSIGRINLYSSNDNNATPLRPGLNLSTLLTPPNAAGTTDDTPLYIKIIHTDSGIETSSKEPLLKRRKTSNPEILVASAGANFQFLDRQNSLAVLANSLQIHYKAISENKSDRNLHAIPFLANGPGTGKSRFLQELPKSFKSCIEQNLELDADCRSTISNAIFINITFGNGTPYIQHDVKMGMEKALCRRILPQFFLDVDAYIDSAASIKLEQTLKEISNGNAIILGVDEVNKVYEVNQEEFKELFRLLGGMMCKFEPLFVPVLAGTVIGPIEDVVTNSMHPPLSIPLPLLSNQSCTKIIESKGSEWLSYVDFDTNKELKLLINDIGGHPRALEFLFNALTLFDPKRTDYYKLIHSHLRSLLIQRYKVSTAPLCKAIAYQYLQKTLRQGDLITFVEDGQTTWISLQEKGIIQLTEGLPAIYTVNVPPIFVACYMAGSSSPMNNFWLPTEERSFWWQDWELFVRDYFQFRFLLFWYVAGSVVSLEEFFSGADVHVDASDRKLKFILPEEATTICTKNLERRFPETSAEIPDLYCFALNASGASSDALVNLPFLQGSLPRTKRRSVTEDKADSSCFIIKQMKWRSNSTTNSRAITNELITNEFEKVRNVMTAHLPGHKFLFVMLSTGCNTYDPTVLPTPTILISNEDQRKKFFGDTIAERLKLY